MAQLSAVVAISYNVEDADTNNEIYTHLLQTNFNLAIFEKNQTLFNPLIWKKKMAERN
ncbi:MAG: hypothetical protein OXN83_05115 [Oligoflexia bacterium]|nr:hypothetical protein [Oligoflexia bacterium]